MKKILSYAVFILIFIFSQCSNWHTDPVQEIAAETPKVRYDNSGIVFELPVPDQTKTVYLKNINNNYLIAGTNSGDVYFSFDKGITWRMTKSLGYSINCIAEYSNGILVGADLGLYEFSKNGDYIKTQIQPIDSLGRSTKINDIVTSSKNYCTAYGFDGNYSSFFKWLTNSSAWSRSSSKIMGNSVFALELATFDLRSADNISFELYYDHLGYLYMYSFLINGSYYYIKKYTGLINSIGISKNSNAYYLGTDKGLLKYPSLNATDYTTYFSGRNINSLLCSTAGSVFASVDGEILYSLNESNDWIKIYTDGDDGIIKFYEFNNYIYALSKNGKLYYFVDPKKSNKSETVLLTPEKNQTVNNQTTLKWYSIEYQDSTANCYQIQLADSDSFNNILLDQKKYNGNSYMLNNLESRKKYYWRVRKNNGEYNYMWTVSEFTVK